MSTDTDWDAIREIFDLVEDADFIQEFGEYTWISVNTKDYQRVMRVIRNLGEDL